MPEIYALVDPRDGAIRYIGKANCSASRFKGHMRDSRRRNTPVYCWIRKLADLGLTPSFKVLDTSDNWQDAERRLIIEHRAKGAKLLNVAEGGDQPFCPTEVRAANGRANAKKRDPRIWRLKQVLGSALKRGHVSDATRAKLASIGIV